MSLAKCKSVRVQPSAGKKAGLPPCAPFRGCSAGCKAGAIVPSWFGIGDAFKSFCAERGDGLKLLQEMYQNWAFFQAVIDNAQLDVAKADMGIAELYASLAEPKDLRRRFFSQIRDQHTLSSDMIKQVTPAAGTA